MGDRIQEATMIKGKFTRKVDGQDANVIFFGLEQGNIELLKKGKPIVVDLRELGLEGQAVISYGETKADIMRDLEKAGVVFQMRWMDN